MKLKINKWEFNVSNKDWILDNGACYQCMTLKHYSPVASTTSGHTRVTIMGSRQFKELVKLGILVFDEEMTKELYNAEYKIYRFNV